MAIKNRIICEGIYEIKWIENYLLKKGYKWCWGDNLMNFDENINYKNINVVIYIQENNNIIFYDYSKNIMLKHIEAKILMRQEKLKRIQR